MSGDYFFGKVLARRKGTGAGTSSGVTVTISGVTGQVHCVTGIEVSGDAAALVTIESPASTILFRKRFAAAFAFSETFPIGTIVAVAATDVLVKISASTSNCEANIQVLSIGG